jgi:superfamily II RNA helicase
MVVSDFRPVPLRYFYTDSEGMYKLFENEDAGPGARAGLVKRIKTKGMAATKAPKSRGKGGSAIKKYEEPGVIEVTQPINDLLRKRALRERRLLLESMPPAARRGPRARTPNGARFTASYRALVEHLKARDLLPSIVFIFSRSGCDRAAAEIGSLANALGLLTPLEKQVVKDRLQTFREQNPQVMYSCSESSLQELSFAMLT